MTAFDHPRWGWLLADLRSTVIGSLFGAIVGSITGLVTVALAKDARLEAIIAPDDQGYAQPMHALLEPLKSDADHFSFSFEPARLAEVWVCEYAHLTGESPSQLVFDYLDRYSMCLAVSRRSENEYVIRPNKRSGEMSEINGEWFCKCAP